MYLSLSLSIFIDVPPVHHALSCSPLKPPSQMQNACSSLEDRRTQHPVPVDPQLGIHSVRALTGWTVGSIELQVEDACRSWAAPLTPLGRRRLREGTPMVPPNGSRLVGWLQETTPGLQLEQCSVRFSVCFMSAFAAILVPYTFGMSRPAASRS